MNIFKLCPSAYQRGPKCTGSFWRQLGLDICVFLVVEISGAILVMAVPRGCPKVRIKALLGNAVDGEEISLWIWMKGTGVTTADPLDLPDGDDRPSVKDLIREHQEKIGNLR